MHHTADWFCQLCTVLHYFDQSWAVDGLGGFSNLQLRFEPYLHTDSDFGLTLNSVWDMGTIFTLFMISCLSIWMSFSLLLPLVTLWNVLDPPPRNNNGGCLTCNHSAFQYNCDILTKYAWFPSESYKGDEWLIYLNEVLLEKWSSSLNEWLFCKSSCNKHPL